MKWLAHRLAQLGVLLCFVLAVVGDPIGALAMAAVTALMLRLERP